MITAIILVVYLLLAVFTFFYTPKFLFTVSILNREEFIAYADGSDIALAIFMALLNPVSLCVMLPWHLIVHLGENIDAVRWYKKRLEKIL